MMETSTTYLMVVLMLAVLLFVVTTNWKVLLESFVMMETSLTMIIVWRFAFLRIAVMESRTLLVWKNVTIRIDIPTTLVHLLVRSIDAVTDSNSLDLSSVMMETLFTTIPVPITAFLPSVETESRNPPLNNAMTEIFLTGMVVPLAAKLRLVEMEY